MVWLDPVIDLLGDLFFECLPLHHLLVHENLLDKDLRETLLELVVSVPDGRRVLAVVDLGASWRRAVFTWGLVPMAHIKPEHEFVGDFVEEGNVGTELSIAGLELVSQLDLHKLIELLGTLAPV